MDSNQLQSAMHTIASLKKEYKTLVAAKTAFNLKAKSWADLVEKLNAPSIEQLQTEIARLNAENKSLKQQLTEAQGFDPIGFWLQDGNFERSKFSDFKAPPEATRKESIAKKFYKELARRYHPDKGGTSEQMANVKKLEDQMMALVDMNGGLGK
jgi:hypothetical protein